MLIIFSSMDTELCTILETIGLSDKEAGAYLSLLKHGTQSTSFIAKKAGLNRGTSYVALHSLLEKGLVIKSQRRSVQYFTAINPKKLVDYLERRELELQAQKERVSAVMGDFLGLCNPLASSPKIEFFEGAEGARTALEETLKAEEKTLRAFLSIAEVGEFLGEEYFEYYTKKRIKRGYTLHAIRTLENDAKAVMRNKYASGYVTKTKDAREVRYVEEDLAFPITMYMFDNKVLLLSSKKEGFALIVESLELSDMQKKLFLMIWNSQGALIE